ncbi:hypothetical protein OPQ81_010915 [Rhizoctonia solani]|nr:hypothetical protein OPQ81_010915 [Rhizoctonia solani]
MRTFSALSTRDLPSRFQYSTNHLTLNLGERNWYCPLPCYGYRGTIEGTVKVHQIDTVSKVEVSLVGEVSTIISEAAVPSQGASKRFLKQKATIWDSKFAQGDNSIFPFAIAFPGGSTSSDPELPPSFRLGAGELSARIQYRIQVDLFRKGLRRHKRFETEVIYLPKSFAPALHVRPMHIDNKMGNSDGWARHVLPPIHPSGRSNAPRAEVPWEMVVELFLPSPGQLVLTADGVIPYTFRIQSVSSAVARASNTPASLALVETHLQLVKSTIVSVHGLTKRKDVILASGTVSSDFQGTNADEGDPSSSSSVLEGVRVVNGSLEVGGRSGSELSWELQDFIEVKYCLIAVAKPPPSVRALEGAFPTFRTTLDVEMKTHTKGSEYNADDIDTDPSVGLFNTS